MKDIEPTQSQALMIIPPTERTFPSSALTTVYTAPEYSRLTAFSTLTARIGLLQEQIYIQEATPLIPNERLVFYTTSQSVTGTQKVENLIIANGASHRVANIWKHMAAGLYYELAESPHTKNAADEIAVRRREEQTVRDNRFLPSTQDALTEAHTVFSAVKDKYDAKQQWERSMQDLWNRSANDSYGQ